MKLRKNKSKHWKLAFEQNRGLYKEIKIYGLDIINSDNFIDTKKHIQHGTTTVYSHCINVAKYSMRIGDFLGRMGVKHERRDLIRGALLHDYFLYDWHEGDPEAQGKLHGFYHPGKALRNAEKEYLLTKKEKDIISKHMWPLTLIPPMCTEAWIVTMADKWCSFLETIKYHKGHGAQIDYCQQKGNEEHKNNKGNHVKKTELSNRERDIKKWKNFGTN